MGSCWPHFPPKWGEAVGRRPPFCWVYVIFRFFGRPGPLLARFGLDFGRFGPPFWRFLGSILEVSGHDLGPMCLVILCASRNPTSPTPQSTNESFKKEQLKKVPKLQGTWDPNRDQKPLKWSSKTSKLEAQTLQNRAEIGPRGFQDDQKIEK